MRDVLKQIIERFGTPCFVYDFDEVRRRTEKLRGAFAGNFKISYAIKANPSGAILTRMRSCVDQLDISSGGELRIARQNGWEAGLCSFTGPGKRDAELEAAVKAGVGLVVVESAAEARRLSRLAASRRRRQAILVRIAPAKVPAGFGSRMAGKPSQFGIDEEDADEALRQIRPLEGVELCGFHVYSGTQCLSAAAIAENYLNCIALFGRLAGEHDLHPKHLVFGSGLGIPYHENETALDVASIGAKANSALAGLLAEKRFEKAELILETGRYLVGEAGVYLTRIVSAKRSRGAEIRICDGGMNHHLGACGHLGSVLHRNYRMFKVGAEDLAAEKMGVFDLFGPLCTSIDNLAHGIKLPPLEVGDVIGIHCSGAYGLTASPGRFISHEPPREILLETVDGVRGIEDVSGR